MLRERAYHARIAASSDNGSPQVVNVLGMHRSGTSLTAHIVGLLGFHLGREEDRYEAKADNPRGFWEQRPIMDLNDGILEALGGSWWRPPDLLPGWEDHPEVQALRPRAQAVLEAQFPGDGDWAWKDPRASLTLPFWRKVMPKAKYVVCLRNPADVVASLLRREPTTHTWESANALWLRYNAEALENTAEEDRLLLFYEDYFTQPDSQLERLARFLGRDLPAEPSPARAEIGAVIEADLRHHRTSAYELAVADAVPTEARAFYLAIRAAHLLSLDAGGREDELEPGISRAIGTFAPQLWHGAREREATARREREDAVAAVERERDEARRAERKARADLDRALERLASAQRQADKAEQLEANLVRARKARLAMRNSLSWRITRPLRVAKTVFRRRTPGPR